MASLDFEYKITIVANTTNSKTNIHQKLKLHKKRKEKK